MQRDVQPGYVSYIKRGIKQQQPKDQSSILFDSVNVSSPLPGQVFLQEDVSARLASTPRCPRLAGLQHAHRAGGVRQDAQVLADGARLS